MWACVPPVDALGWELMFDPPDVDGMGWEDMLTGLPEVNSTEYSYVVAGQNLHEWDIQLDLMKPIS